MNPIEAYHLMHNGTLALARAEAAGIRVDMDYLNAKIAHLERRIARMEQKFRDSKFHKDWEASQEKVPNPNSGLQLSKFLYETKGLKPPKLTKGGRGSVDKEALTELNIPELMDLLYTKKLMKIKTTYLEGFKKEQVDGWIHPFFNLHLVTTFRSSSDRPNFQNIPKRDKEAMKITRGALFPRKGHQLLEVDYGQLEVRIAYCYNKDPQLLHDILKGDMHTDMAKQIFMIDDFDKHKPEHALLRGAAKNGFVFPQFYGDYYKNCAEYLAREWGQLPRSRWKAGQGVSLNGAHLADHLIEKGIGTPQKFENHLKAIEQDFWENRYKVYARWKERQWRQYQKVGYVDSLTGFRCKGVLSRNDATNYPIQGAAFHCLLWSLIQIDNLIQQKGWKSRIIGQIHDSVNLDVFPPELDKLVKEIKRITCVALPEAWEWIKVPLDISVDIAPVDCSWAKIKEL